MAGRTAVTRQNCSEPVAFQRISWLRYVNVRHDELDACARELPCHATPASSKNCRTQMAAAPAALVTGNNSHGHRNRSLFLSLRRGAVYTVPTAMQMHSVTVKNWVDRHTDSPVFCTVSNKAPLYFRFRLYQIRTDLQHSFIDRLRSNLQ